MTAACTTIYVTKSAFKAIGGHPPHNARKTALFPAQLLGPDLDRLTSLRRPDENYSEAILRLAKLEKRCLK